MTKAAPSFKEFKNLLNDFTKASDGNFLTRLGIEKKNEVQHIEEAYLPQSLIESSLKEHILIVNENLNFKEVYKILVQVLGMKKNQNETQSNNMLCSSCLSHGIQSCMSFNEVKLQYLCGTCNDIKYMTHDINPTIESNKVFSSKWTTTLKNWVKYIYNGLGEDENINSAQNMIKQFSKNKNRINSIHNLIAAVLLIVERPTILEDEKVGPLDIDYCNECGEVITSQFPHVCIMCET